MPEYRSTGDGRFVALSRGLSGAFLDPAQPGTGLWIDVGHDDNTFMTLMTYAGREDGGADPVFYTLGGPIRLQPSGILGIAGVASPLYESRDGQRIDGAWRAPTTRVATELGTASVVLVSQDVVRLDVAGRTYRMVALRPDRAATDIPRGRWLLTLRDALVFDPDGTRPPGMPATVLESVTAEVQVTPNTMSRGSGSEALPLLVPSPAARTFAVACSASCGDFDAWRAGHELALWVEPDGIAVMSQVARQVATGTHVPASARQYRLVLHDDAIDGFGTRLHLPVDGRTLNRGELRMYRNPPQAFCDTDAACF